uniref:Si:dkey-71d15.2 n=1 Tax=Cyprinus carpio carpio TaxID=630221 RepID=A0A9J8CQZ1_CYPCA
PSLAAKPRGAPQGPGTMEQMRAELRELRDELDTLKTQKEIKLLMNELDEEKKMRLSLQIDVERLKKRMSK